MLARPEEHAYDEGWLQRQIHAHPSILPIWEIEPSCWPATPVCMELPIGSGFADNLLVSPDGNLVVVECKLWRNPEARRKVIAQVIDYAKDLMRLDYAGLERQILLAQERMGSSLYEIAATDLEEKDFIDAVSRNLRRGRMLLLIAGDGITESVEAITDYLQQHAGIHFTLAMVQLAVFDLGAGQRLIVPSVPLRSVNIVRGIVEIRDGQPVVTAPPTAVRAGTLTEEQFLERLDAIRPGTSARLRELLELGQDVGLETATASTMLFKIALGDRGSCNVFAVAPNGHVDTSYIWFNRGAIADELISSFLEDWARSIPDVEIARTPRNPYLRHQSRPLQIWDLLDHADSWLPVVRSFREEVIEAQSRAQTE